MIEQKERIMNIAYCTNRDYLPYMLVSMHSLLTIGRDNRDLRIMLAVDKDIREEDLAPLYKMISRFPGCTIEVKWPMGMSVRRFAVDGDCCMGPDAAQAAYLRLLLPELFAGEDRCLYLDCDLVVVRSITEMYDMQMDGMFMAGVTDRICLEESQRRRLLHDWKIEGGYYVNSGVLLMDLGKMRTSGKDKEALELAYSKPFRYVDQDVLNQIYQGGIRLLPKNYNVFSDDCYEDLALLRNLIPDKKNLFPDEALDNPSIIHYIGPNKPWVVKGVPHEKAWHEAEAAYASFSERECSV